MNKITELWEQCKTPDWTYDNQTCDHEKFAELIVEECIEIISKEFEHGIDRHDDYNLALYEVYQEIKLHFEDAR